jgi:hypothetical protein
MTPKEAFKIGFLEKCAKDGLTPEQTMMRIQHAKFMLKAASAEKSAALWPWLLFGPPAAGMLGGYTLASMQNDPYDSEEATKREEIAEYERALARLQKLQARQVAAG